MAPGRLFVDPETFLLPHEAEWVLYAPLKALALLVNAAARDALARLEADPDYPIPSSLAAPLENLGVLLPRPFAPRVPDRVRPVLPPTEVSLFLTGECNLRCAYCYSSGGERPARLPRHVALEAASHVIQNAAEQGQRARIHFHGGGEPTLAMPVLLAVVEHARAECARRRVELELSIGTNGVMPPEAATTLARCMTSMTLSMDGRPETHDAFRRRPDGGGSYADVEATCRVFDAEGGRYNLRMTVSDVSVGQLAADVAHLVRVSGARRIKAEPLFAQGRAGTLGMRPPDPDAFVEAFWEARRLAREAGRELVYSGARIDVAVDRFCAAAAGSMCVTPEGDLTACYEVVHRDDPRAPHFFFGKYAGSFERDEGSLARIASLTLRHVPECEGCFARWHCAGDCPAKVLAPESLASAHRHARTWRCAINRELTRRAIVEAVVRGEDLHAPPTV